MVKHRQGYKAPSKKDPKVAKQLPPPPECDTPPMHVRPKDSINSTYCGKPIRMATETVDGTEERVISVYDAVNRIAEAQREKKATNICQQCFVTMRSDPKRTW